MKILLYCSVLFFIIGSNLYSQSLAGYEYWFDDDYDNKVYTAITGDSISLDFDLDIADLSEEKHYIHLRVEDSNGMWSDIISRFFLNNKNEIVKNITKIEYWFDSDIASKTTVAMTTPSETLVYNNEIDISSLSKEKHYIHFRTLDDSSMYSPIISRYFLKNEELNSKNITHIEYWFDSDIASKTSVVITPTVNSFIYNEEIDISSLAEDKHYIHFRTVDDSSLYSPIISKFFYNNEDISVVKVDKYQYWYGTNLSNVFTTALVKPTANDTTIITELDLTGLSQEKNYINFRVADNNDTWSNSVNKYFFNNKNNDEIKLTAYRYWFDSDSDNLHTVNLATPIIQTALEEEIDVSALSTGKHYIHFQVQDDSALFSPPNTKYFRNRSNIENYTLKSYEFWIDDNYDTRYSEDLTLADKESFDLKKEIQPDTLSPGYHNYYVRFKYANELWSPLYNAYYAATMTNDFFLKKGWNMISTYVNPIEKALETIYEPASANFIITKNGNGRIYYPLYNINQIGDWDYREGYLSYVSEMDTISIDGFPLPDTLNLPLKKGWNMIAFTNSNSIPIETALDTLGSNFIIIKNGNGQIYYPFYSINTINNMLPGQGYLIYMNVVDTLVYKSSVLKRKVKYEDYTLKYFKPITSPNNAIYLFDIILPNDTEIGVFNISDELIGAGVVKNNFACVSVFSDDNMTNIVDGARTGETMKFIAYNDALHTFNKIVIDEATNVFTESKIAKLTYQTNSIFRVKAKIELKNSAESTMTVFPNPAKNNAQIALNSIYNEEVEISIVSLDGKKICDVFSGKTNLGQSNYSVDLSQYTSGNYFILLKRNSDIEYKSLIIQR